jgi:hypothetical protein
VAESALPTVFQQRPLSDPLTSSRFVLIALRRLIALLRPTSLANNCIISNNFPVLQGRASYCFLRSVPRSVSRSGPPGL